MDISTINSRVNTFRAAVEFINGKEEERTTAWMLVRERIMQKLL